MCRRHVLAVFAHRMAQVERQEGQATHAADADVLTRCFADQEVYPCPIVYHA